MTTMDISTKSCAILILVILSSGVQSFRIVRRHSLFAQMRNTHADGPKLFFQHVQDHSPPLVKKLHSGESLSLTCEAGGSPSPTIHWLYKGNRIPQGSWEDISDDEAAYEDTLTNRNMETLRLGSTSAKLIIDCLSSADQGEYTCVAETPFKRISTTTVVEVASSGQNSDTAEKCLEDRLGVVSEPPRIYMYSVQRLEFEEADVQLFCRASGSPSPRIAWYDRNEQPIGVNDPQHTILSNGDLLIKGVNWMTNMGLYRCKASNEAGDDEVSTFLYPTTPL